MIIMSIASMILALFVVAPLSLPKRRPKSTDSNFNVLFFDHFSMLTHAEYQSRMNEIMETPEQVKEAMVKDIYQIGNVLQSRKYPFLKLSAFVFIIGIIISLLLLVTQLLFV